MFRHRQYAAERGTSPVGPLERATAIGRCPLAGSSLSLETGQSVKKEKGETTRLVLYVRVFFCFLSGMYMYKQTFLGLSHFLFFLLDVIFYFGIKRLVEGS